MLRLETGPEHQKWRKRVGGEVVAYWCISLDKACATAAHYEDLREKAEEEKRKKADDLHRLLRAQ